MAFSLKKIWVPAALAGFVVMGALNGSAIAEEKTNDMDVTTEDIQKSYPTPLVIYHQNKETPDAKALIYVRARVEQNGDPKFVNAKECFVVSSGQLENLVTNGDVSPLVEAPVKWVFPEQWRNSALAHSSPDIIDFEQYETSKEADIHKAVSEGYEIYREFMTTVTDSDFRAALEKKLRNGTDPKSLWEGNEYYPDVRSFIDGVLDTRREDMHIFATSAFLARQGTTDFKFRVFKSEDKKETEVIRASVVYSMVRELENIAEYNNSRWKSNPFYTLGLDKKHPKLIEKAQRFVEKYEQLAKNELAIVAMRNFIDSYDPLISKGLDKPVNHETPGGCSTVTNISKTNPGPGLS